jgi:hypothetical protein
MEYAIKCFILRQGDKGRDGHVSQGQGRDGNVRLHELTFFQHKNEPVHSVTHLFTVKKHSMAFP